MPLETKHAVMKAETGQHGELPMWDLKEPKPPSAGKLSGSPRSQRKSPRRYLSSSKDPPASRGLPQRVCSRQEPSLSARPVPQPPLDVGTSLRISLPPVVGALTARPSTRQRKRHDLQVSAELNPTSASIPLWWNPPSDVGEEADAFDHDYAKLSTKAYHAFRALATDTTSARRQFHFERSVYEIQSRRLRIQPLRFRSAISPYPGLLPDMHLGGRASGPWLGTESRLEAGVPIRRQRWTIADSVWQGRYRSGRLQETDELLGCIFDYDWSIAKGAHGLSRYILRVDCTEPNQPD